MKKLLLLFLFVSLPCYATGYYIKNGGNDNLDGLTDATAWATVSKVNGFSQQPGDNYHFKNDSVWREELIPKSGTGGTENILVANTTNYITYTNYGDGAEYPLFLGSVSSNSLEDWTDEGGNLWSSPFASDVGNIIFNKESLPCGVKKQTKVITNEQGDFWYDFVNDKVFLYSSSNPALYYSDIECVLNSPNASALTNKHCLIFDSLRFKYWGTLGTLWGASTHHIIIDNIDVGYTGGNDQYGDYTVRYGGGFGTWNNGNNWLLTNSRIYQGYDGGFTNQGTGDGSVVYNIYVYNNLFYDNEFTYELWNHQDSVITTIHFMNNTCLRSNGSWAHNQRWNGAMDAHLKFYTLSGSYSDIRIENNIFDTSDKQGIYFSTPADMQKVNIDNNLWNVTTLVKTGTPNIAYSQATWQALGQDTHSIFTDPLLNDDYTLKSNSPCRWVGKANSYINDDYFGRSRPTLGNCDIGASQDSGYIQATMVMNGL